MSYRIERMDVILQNNRKYPIIYIKPDMKFLELIRENSFAVMVQLSNTGVYDGCWIPATVNKSCNVPSCRPNYYEATGYYVLTLFTNWNGYPYNLGTVKIMGLKEVKKAIKAPNFFPKSEFQYRKPDTSCIPCKKVESCNESCKETKVCE